MMLYLTGADNSLAKSGENLQEDASKSLGGYISSSVVPNAALNVLFDSISNYTIEKKPRETIALGLINKFENSVKDVELKIITHPEDQAEYKVAVVEVGSQYSMEHISNRYQEPINGEFHNASFQRAFVDLVVNNPASEGEEIALYPFNVVVQVEESGIEGTWEAIEQAFSDDDTYKAIRLKEFVFRIERRDEMTIEVPSECSYITTEGFRATFLGYFENKVNKTVLISELIDSNEALGIWIQRSIKKNIKSSNEQMLEDYKSNADKSEVEQVELIISYNLVQKEDEGYNKDYDNNYK